MLEYLLSRPLLAPMGDRMPNEDWPGGTEQRCLFLRLAQVLNLHHWICKEDRKTAWGSISHEQFFTLWRRH